MQHALALAPDLAQAHDRPGVAPDPGTSALMGFTRDSVRLVIGFDLLGALVLVTATALLMLSIWPVSRRAAMW